eukprot:5884059-Pleurochrysis_carterae.AAC.1
MATPAAALAVSTESTEARAAAAVVRAVRRARRANDDAYGKGSSAQQPPVDFTSLGLTGWNGQGAQSLWRLADGRVLFTGGHDVAYHATTEGAGGPAFLSMHCAQATQHRRQFQQQSY